MKLVGYSDVETNWSTDFSNKRSTADYQKQIESYEKFYFDVLKDIEIRRKSTFKCKGIFADIIDRIDNPGYYSSKITLKDISEKLKKATRAINKNM